MKWVYYGLAVLGLLLTYSEMIPFVLENNGFDWNLFVDQMYASRMSRFIAYDLMVTGLVFIVFMLSDKNKPKYWLLSVLTIFLVGICSAFPIYLALKEDQKK